jgi:ferritin-like metal-binding protein YciE
MAMKKSSRSTKETPTGQDLLVMELQEIHNAESQLSRVLPRFSKVLESEALQSMVDERLEEGEQIIKDIEASLEEMEESPGRKKNVAAEGLIADMREHAQEIEAGPALDSVLTAAIQKTEHYCIAAWGTAKSLGAATGQKSVVRAMDRALKEGEKFDERLTQLAEKELTPALLAMASEGGQSSRGQSSKRDGAEARE